MIRMCVNCKFFELESSTPDYSDWTPGAPEVLRCMKRHFNINIDCESKVLEWLRKTDCEDFIPYKETSND